MQFTVGQVTVHFLVVGLTSTLLIMPIRIIIHTLILATLTLLRMERLTVLQSWLEPVSSHLTRLRYFISLESRCLLYSHARRNHPNSKKNYILDIKSRCILILAITDFPDFFKRFGAKMVPNTGLPRDAHRSPICVYIWLTSPHVAYLNSVCPSTLENA